MTDYDRAVRLLRLAAAVTYCLSGVPCVYYGEEAGMQGYEDPFNRKCYPWGSEDNDLIAYFQKLGEIRKREELNGGSINICSPVSGVVEIVRGDKLRLVANASKEPFAVGRSRDLISGDVYSVVPPETALLFEIK